MLEVKSTNQWSKQLQRQFLEKQASLLSILVGDSSTIASWLIH